MKNDKSAYWTAFCFKGEPDPNSLHCTHKFLGPLNDSEAKAVRSLISRHMREVGGFLRFKVPFTKVDFFGDTKTVRVLLPTDEGEFRAKYLALGYDALREDLDRFREDDWGFRAHVSSPNHTLINDYFNAYVLMRGRDIVARWSCDELHRAVTPTAKAFNAKDYVEIRPVRENPADWDEMEARIKAAFRKKLYAPLLKLLRASPNRLTNSAEDDLIEAIQSGRITFNRGVFQGKLTAKVSKALKEIGASWDKSSGAFRLPLSQMPTELADAIRISEDQFKRKLDLLDRELRQNLPAEIADSVKTADIFDRQLWKVDKDLGETLKKITVTPKLSKAQRQRIADEWQDNMDLWIQGFAEEEISRLRTQVQSAFKAGERYESLVSTIEDSYGVTERKAKFLARQESHLLLAKFKETRYIAAGVEDYRWKCVAGSAAHPVRPSHKVLDNRIFRYDDPPITTAPGEAVRRNNPGQDYNCRCNDIPIVRRV